jgi:limonene-1,2-epoxide hydrolase
MEEAEIRRLIEEHFAAASHDQIKTHEIYTDDAVLEFPQGGERIRGEANIIAMRSAYPANLEFEMHRTTGRGDLWVNEYIIRYDGRPVHVVGIMEFRDGKVFRERIYFGDAWDPPEWRAQWVEPLS